jgi:hypothetical protein
VLRRISVDDPRFKTIRALFDQESEAHSNDGVLAKVD